MSVLINAIVNFNVKINSINYFLKTTYNL